MTRYAVAGDGVRIAFDAAGEGGVPLLLVHGWGCERSYLAPQFARYSAERRVVAVDLRGYGESDPGDPAAHGVETFADDVLAAAEAAGAQRPVVVGHSMGALVALACAARPGAVRGAVLLDPAPVASPSGKASFAAAVGRVAADADGAWRRRFVTGLFGPADTVRRAEAPEGAAAMPLPVAAAGMRAMAEYDGASAMAAAEAGGTPVLVVTAGRPERALAEWRYAATGRVVGAGHYVQLEVPEQVNAMIDRFLVVNGLGG